uniref:Uncharacterized protein n=1 Tax=Eutreptiella gymnastica TaxID=73025 RepID=A0A7S1IEE6_9EUGL
MYAPPRDVVYFTRSTGECVPAVLAAAVGKDIVSLSYTRLCTNGKMIAVKQPGARSGFMCSVPPFYSARCRRISISLLGNVVRSLCTQVLPIGLLGISLPPSSFTLFLPPSLCHRRLFLPNIFGIGGMY